MKTVAIAAGVMCLLAVTGCSSTTPAEPTTPTSVAPTVIDDTVTMPTGNADEVAASVIGMTEEDAVAAATAAGVTTRVGSRDGEDFPLTMDFNYERVTFTIVDGVVTEATVG